MPDDKKVVGKDEFWDLESLLPSRKKPAPRFEARDTEAVEISQSPTTLKGAAFSEALFVEHPVPSRGAHNKSEIGPLYSYQVPNALLREVRVYEWSKYDYYEQFAAHARQFYEKEGKECHYVDFFSYAPQYYQMNAAQMAYYFWWRQNFREGKCLPASPSYQLLYVYEIINLGKHIPPELGQKELVRLWLSYRQTNPRLDALLREWIVDYSLLYRLPAPELPRALYRDLLHGAKLKEFFVPLGGQSDVLTTAVLLFGNNYDYTKSKFFNAETASDFHRVLSGAVDVALAYLRENASEGIMGKNSYCTVTRETFIGAICSWKLRKRIEVDYTSFSRTHELRYLISDVLKYAENALRARRGIKSRLSIYAVDSALRERLDEYLEKMLPARVVKKEKKREEVPAYEKRYDLPVRAPSLARAAEIESDSWETTKRLVEAFEEPQIEEKVPNGVEKVPPAPITTEVSPVTESAQAHPTSAGGTLGEALGDLAAFLSLKGAKAQREFSLSRGIMVDAIVDKINTVAGDMLGDILLEAGDDGYVIIEDYLDILIEEGVWKDGE